MNSRPTVKSVCAPSENVVAREIEGEMILVPLTADTTDADAELYTLNETGKMFWHRLDGKATLAEIADALAAEFDASAETIAADILGLAGELAKRSMLTVRDP